MERTTERTMRVKIDADLVRRLRELAIHEGDARSGVATVVNRMLRSALTAAKVEAGGGSRRGRAKGGAS